MKLSAESQRTARLWLLLIPSALFHLAAIWIAPRWIEPINAKATTDTKPIDISIVETQLPVDKKPIEPRIKPTPPPMATKKAPSSSTEPRSSATPNASTPHESTTRSPDEIAQLEAQRSQLLSMRRTPSTGTSSPSAIKLNFDHRAFDQLYGQEAENARTAARISSSESSGEPRGRGKRKKIREALGSFTGDVQPGNQAPLDHRVHTFDSYIELIHHPIHKQWADQFLASLDFQPQKSALNDPSLWTMLELVILPNGTLEKATVVRPSGQTAFDVAALDVAFTVSPFTPPPASIRSVDQKVYLHWRFHRDHRQCGTFGVDPYILATPPRRTNSASQPTSQPEKRN